MEVNIFNKTTYKRTENVRIATGVIAIIAAVGLVYSALRNGSFGVGFVNLFFYLFQIAMMVSMIMYAVYALAFYGKKTSKLLGYSALTLAGARFINVVYNVLWIIIMPNWYGFSKNYELYPRLIAIYVVDCIVSIIIGVIFLMVALKYFNRNKMDIKKLLIVALVVVFSTNILRIILNAFLMGGFVFDISNILFGLLYISPFLLFSLFCPPNHKRVKMDMTNSPLQEQEMIIEDLNSQLLYLKNEFERGKITKQEYDYKRKSLVDKL